RRRRFAGGNLELHGSLNLLGHLRLLARGAPPPLARSTPLLRRGPRGLSIPRSRGPTPGLLSDLAGPHPRSPARRRSYVAGLADFLFLARGELPLVANGAPPPFARSTPLLPSRASRTFYSSLAGSFP